MRSVINFGHRTTYGDPTTTDVERAPGLAPSRRAFPAAAADGEVVPFAPAPSSPTARDDASPVGGSPALRRLLVGLDVLALVLAWGLTLVVPGVGAGADRSDLVSLGAATAAVALGLWLLASQRLYWARVCSVRTVEIGRLAKVSVLLGALVGASSALVGVDVRAAEAAVGGIATMVFLLMFRSGYRGWLRDRRREGRFCRPVMLVGLNEEALDMQRLLDHHPELGFRVTAVLGAREEAARLGMASLWAGEVADAPAVARSSTTTGAVVVASAVASEELNRMLVPLIEARRVGAGEDFISRLWAGGEQILEGWGDVDMLDACRLLLFAGIDTTTHALANGFHRVLTMPGLARELRVQGRVAIFAEELLRLDGSVHYRPRQAAVDVQLGGAEVKQGDMLMVLLLAANRDPARHGCPHDVDLERPALRDHLAFSYGARACPGAALARAELVDAFELALARFPSMELDGDAPPPGYKGFLMRSHRPLNVRLA